MQFQLLVVFIVNDLSQGLTCAADMEKQARKLGEEEDQRVSPWQDEFEEEDLPKPYERWVPKIKPSLVLRAPSISQMKEVLMMSRCVECGKVPPPNFLVCASGHMTCSECGSEGSEKVCRFKSTEEGMVPCQMPLIKQPSLLYKRIFNQCTFKCGANPCQDKYYGRDLFSHSRKCSGGKNFICPAWGCKEIGRFEKEPLMDHIIENHYFLFYCGPKWLLTPELWWWIDRDVPRIVFMLGCRENLWIGVSIRRRIEGENTCIFVLFSAISAQGRGEGGYSSFRARLAFRMENCRRTTWEGIPPCLTENLDEILTTNRCLVISGVEPKEILNLEIELIEAHDDEPSRLPILEWKSWNPHCFIDV